MKRELKLPDDAYRAIVHRASNGRCESSADMTAAERDRLLDGLRKLGGGKDARSRFTGAPQHAKARAIWIALFEGGVVNNRSDRALDAYIKRQTGQELGALDAAGWGRVIEGLKSWAARKGVALQS
jgi:phage gp16-like protein